jgi:PAS domain S-box-containing protein
MIKNCLVDIYINLSLYYLKKIGNYCQAIYFYKKVSEFILSYQEDFSFNRLNLLISKTLIEKLKPSNEQVSSLEYLDVSQYYKYDCLTQNFIDEISNDVNLSLEFWKTFRAPLKDSNKSIDFNKIFKLTDQIRISKEKVEHMWNELLSIYNGVNEYFELYSTYVVEINDDDLKKRDLDSLKRKNDNINENLNKNFYSILFNKNTGIIIANGDRGSEGQIELSNNEIENIFNYKACDLKGKNLTKLMPKILMKEHSKYMQQYFKIGEKKIIDNDNVFSFGKDKNNNIIKIKLAIKLFPVLNKNVFYIGLIVKENVEDIIFMDDKFNIQGMSSSLVRKLGIDNRVFQECDIPFYIICKKFVHFYSIFLHKAKKTDEHIDFAGSLCDSKNNSIIIKKNILDYKDEEYKKNVENVEINENIELEYEIKIPNFLFEFNEKLKKKSIYHNIVIDNKNEENAIINYNYTDDQNEDEPLIDEKRKSIGSKFKSSILFSSVIDKKSTLKKSHRDRTHGETPNHTPTGTPTPTPTPSLTPTGKDNFSKNDKKDKKDKKGKNKDNNEKTNYNSIINKYVNLFENYSFSRLEDLIDTNNLNSPYEYKFNFTFDRYKYGNNNISYIVRCVDNKNDAGKSEEETINDVDPKGVRYKKEKIEAIKPLYELYPSEKDELREYTENFIKLSLENYNLQRALQICKNDIKEMSIAYGQKEDIVVKDENSSQIAQSGFDSGLVKKNRIEEIKSNLLVNIENFYILKYIKGVIILIGLFTTIFGCIYIILFLQLHKILKDVSLLNVRLFQNCLWTTEIVSIFISLKTLNKNILNENFFFNNYKENENDNNLTYYDRMKEFATTLYYDLLYANEALEKDISNYLDQNDLMSLYWDRINISYKMENYTAYNNKQVDTESFPMAMAQLLSNCLSFLTNDIFNITNETIDIYNNLTIEEKNETDAYSAHILYIIIENSYDNILPNHLNKIEKIPLILQKYNENKKFPAIISIIIYSCIMIILCSLYYILLCLTNKSLTGGLNKVTKIR